MALKKNIGLGIRTSLVLGASLLATSIAFAGGLFQVSLSDYPTTAPKPTLSWELSNPLPPHNVIQTGTGTPNAQGILSINPTTDGVYDVRISGSHFLSDKLASVRVHAYPDLGPYDVLLVNGDINQDDSIDLLDYFDLSDAYNTVPGDPGWNADCDLNADESVDLLDYFILSENWELTGTENPRKLTTKGREFWLAFLRNDHHQEDEIEPHERLIHVMGQGGTNLTFSGGAVGAAVQAQIPSAGVLEQVFSSTVEHSGGIGVSSHVVRASADKPVSLQQLTFAPTSSEGYCVLPQNSLGLDHVVVSYPTKEGAFLAVIAPFGNASHSLTSLQITPSVDIPGATVRPAGVPFNVTLASGEIYYLSLSAPNTSTEGAAYDLSGTIITSNHPVAVLSGARGARIPFDATGPTNHLVEQIPPVDQLDKDYLVAPLSGRTSAGRIRIVGSRDNTLVSGLGGFPVLIHRGDIIEVPLIGGQGKHVTGSKPFLLAHYADSATNAIGGDPSFLVVPGTNALGNRATVYTPSLDAVMNPLTQSTVPWNHRVNVYCQSSAVGSLTRNGTVIPATSFSPISGSPYSYGSISVDPGTQVLVDPRGTSAGPVSVSGYGQSWYDSYLLASSEAIQYVGGLNSPPAIPTGVSAVVLQDQETLAHVVNVSWTDNSTTEDGFFVDRKVGSGGWSRVAFVGANVTSYQDVSSPLDRIVSYRVRATGDQSSDPSAVADVVTPPVPPITATIDAVAHNQVKVDWADSSLTELAYEVERKQAAGGWALVHTSAANTTTWTDGSTGPLVNYTYRVRAKNGNLVSAWTGQLPILTPDIPPTPVTNLSGTPFDHQRIDLSWTPGQRATHVEIQRTKTPATESSWATVGTYPVGTNSTSDSGLSGLTQYHYRARSKNTGGVSAWASTSATTFQPVLPVAPTNVIAVAYSATAATVGWNHDLYNVDGFEIQSSRLLDGQWEAWGNVRPTEAVTSTVYSGLEPESTYKFRVRAFNWNKTQFSGWVEGTMQVNTPMRPEAPIEPSAVACGPDRIRVYWIRQPDATGYRIYRSTNPTDLLTSEPYATVAGTEHYYTDYNLPNDTSYYYYVTTMIGNSESPRSIICGTTTAFDAIPWDGQDWEILEAVSAASGGIDGEGDLFYPDRVTVMTPDDRVIRDYGTFSESYHRDSYWVQETGEAISGGYETSICNTADPMQGNVQDISPKKPEGPYWRKQFNATKYDSKSVEGIVVEGVMPGRGTNGVHIPSLSNSSAPNQKDSPHFYIGFHGEINVEVGWAFNYAGLIEGIQHGHRFSPYIRDASKSPQFLGFSDKESLAGYDRRRYVMGETRNTSQPSLGIPLVSDSSTHIRITARFKNTLLIVQTDAKQLSVGAQVMARERQLMAMSVTNRIEDENLVVEAQKPGLRQGIRGIKPRFVFSIAQQKKNSGTNLAPSAFTNPQPGLPDGYFKTGSAIVNAKLNGAKVLLSDGSSVDFGALPGAKIQDYRTLPCTTVDNQFFVTIRTQ